MSEPKNIAQLRAFLGMVTYYSAFVPSMKDLDARLKKDAVWKWSSEEQEAFKNLKEVLSSDMNLAHYDPRQKLVVAADASDYGIGCVISHRYPDGSEKPIAHASRSWPEVEPKLAPFFNRKETLSIVEDCLLMGERVIIPKELRARVLKELHIGHPGIVRMKKLARSYVYWPNIDDDCQNMVRNCSKCQEYAKNPIKVPLESWPTPTRAWQRIHVDFAGPICSCYYMVIVDAYSKWPEVIEMKNISANQT
ncbi:hypothetical protein COOONC_13888, partial [Cooperia oncophora]